MWLIRDKNKRFINSISEVDTASSILRQSVDENSLTLVVGNGLSQSAAWFHRRQHADDVLPSISWSDVVRKAAAKANPDYKKEFLDDCRNNLALAQSVLINSEKLGTSAHLLLSELEAALSHKLENNAIDASVLEIACHDIVTTNYDFQLERALEARDLRKWMALVRTDSDYEYTNETTWIHKMHGSFRPPREIRTKYRFPGEQVPRSTIVITEKDYDSCFRSLGYSSEDEPAILHALRNRCLILGKSLDPQDISFIFALRASRTMDVPRYVLLADEPTADEKVMMDNLSIKPLIINMPRSRSDGHYYFGILAALGRLFGGKLEQIFQEACVFDASFANLTRSPAVVAIGLASKNLTGKAEYNQKNAVLTAGRRNLNFNNSEEHLGGSALTALLVLSGLCDHGESKTAVSIVSSIGNAREAMASEILKECGKYGIDTDAVSRNRDNSWHSTVLIHSSRVAGCEYPGQRIFLDRGYNGPVSLEPPQMEQMIAQIKNPNLQVLYFDKFLGQQQPPPVTGQRIDETQLGPLLREQTLTELRAALARRPEIDVVYETGGGGSPLAHVESRVKDIVNVFTAGFPFAANKVFLADDNEEGDVALFTSGQWWNREFEEEAAAIEEIITSLVGSDDPSADIVPFVPSETVLGRAAAYAGRATSNRQWFIATCHHRGAVGLDLKARKGWFAPAPKPKLVENTSGAGDTFRGALMFALLQEQDHSVASLPTALSFATKVATKRCEYFRFMDAIAAIKAEFSQAYEAHKAAIRDLL